MNTLFRIVLLLTLMSPCAATYAQDETNPQRSSNTIEQTVNFDKNILSKKLDYELLPSETGSFKLRFINNPSDYMEIKIFDVIGNLILTESVMMPENSEKIYYFENSENKIYVIKVESGKENLIKKISI